MSCQPAPMLVSAACYGSTLTTPTNSDWSACTTVDVNTTCVGGCKSGWAPSTTPIKSLSPPRATCSSKGTFTVNGSCVAGRVCIIAHMHCTLKTRLNPAWGFLRLAIHSICGIARGQLCDMVVCIQLLKNIEQTLLSVLLLLLPHCLGLLVDLHLYVGSTLLGQQTPKRPWKLLLALW